ncbi:MAG: DUF4180 domain-containing protein [Vicinamibacterales bacterium]
MTAVEWQTVEEAGIQFVECAACRSCMRVPQDVTLVLEACFAVPTRLALLYSSNLTPRFFDVSSREAGDILQKLRTYHVRAAVVREPGAPRPSRRFHELLEAERRDGHFDVFDDRGTAVAWLIGAAPGEAAAARD